MEKNIKQKLTKRLKILEGQIRGLQKMLDEDKYCVDILIQSSAAKEAISGFENALLESHLSTCVISQINSGEEDKAISEILKIYKISKKI